MGDFSLEVKTVLWAELEKLDGSQVFGEEVCWIFISVDEEDFCELSLNYFPNVMVADVYVLRLFLSHGITGDEYRALIISADRNGC